MLKYKSEKFELLINSAITAANNKTKPLAASSLKNHLNGDDKYFNIFYLIKSKINNFTSFIDRYKLSNTISIFGIIKDSCTLNVSKINIKAIKEIIITIKILK